jgi:hypothetical protein
MSGEKIKKFMLPWPVFLRGLRGRDASRRQPSTQINPPYQKSKTKADRSRPKMNHSGKKGQFGGRTNGVGPLSLFKPN